MLHGFGASKESFSAQISYFAQNFRVIALDFPGFGASSPIPFPYKVKDYAAVVETALEALGVSSCYLLGHSFGGRIATYLAANSGRVEKLVLADSAGVKPRFSFKKYCKMRRFQRKKTKMGEGERAKYGSPDYRALSPVERQSFSLVVGEDLTPYFGKITCPTLLIWGKRDKETPLYMAKKFHKGIKNGTLVVLKNAGHFAMVDQAQAFNRAVMAFLLAKNVKQSN